ncbi:unnamed protein product, partial [Ectocarpus sp. 12 AP-2014]
KGEICERRDTLFVSTERPRANVGAPYVWGREYLWRGGTILSTPTPLDPAAFLALVMRRPSQYPPHSGRWCQKIAERIDKNSIDWRASQPRQADLVFASVF